MWRRFCRSFTSTAPPPPYSSSTGANAIDKRRLLISTASFSLSGLALYGLYRYERQKAASQVQQSRLKKAEKDGAGKALVGGPFSLVDLEGVPRTDLDYREKYLLLYFG